MSYTVFRTLKKPDLDPYDLCQSYSPIKVFQFLSILARLLSLQLIPYFEHSDLFSTANLFHYIQPFYGETCTIDVLSESYSAVDKSKSQRTQNSVEAYLEKRVL